MHRFEFFNAPVDGGTILLLIVLCILGSCLTQQDSRLRALGKRIAFAAFFVFVWLSAHEWEPGTADEWVAVILRSLIFSGIVLGTIWTLLPALFFAYGHTFGAFSQAMTSCSQSSQQRSQDKKAERERRKREVQWERDRPHREREAHVAALQAEADDRVKASAQKRREEARLRSELLYERHSQKLATAFPRERFEQFLERYMNDRLSPDDVEQREQLLKETIRDALGTEESSAPKFRSVAEIAAYFESRRQELEQLPHGEEVVDHYRVQINKQEDEALRRFLKS